MNKIISFIFALSFTLLPALLHAQQSEMSKIQVNAYMQSYDRAFDINRSLMQENVESGLLSGKLRISETSSCRFLMSNKEKQVSLLDSKSEAYHQNLGALDGKWDGRQEGCQEGFQLMAKRIQIYKEELKNLWVEGTSLGEKIAAIELQLFSSSPLDLEDKCLNARRVQGLTKVFLSNEVPAQQQLSEVQLDCQSQARVVVQRYVDHKQRLMAEAKQSQPSLLERSAASIQE